jgi:trehalose 6-phosphate phosphatase
MRGNRIGKEKDTLADRRAPSSILRIGAKHETRSLARYPHYLSRRWPAIAARLRGADLCALFLDFDGTLVTLRNRPEDVRVPARVRRILGRLACHPHLVVALVSGRSVWSLRRLLKENRVRYFGLHGAEADGIPPTLSRKTKLVLGRARLDTHMLLRSLPGIWIEDKGLSFSVHYRGARPATVRAANKILLNLLAPLRHALHVLEGDKVWEVLPVEFEGKGATVKSFMRELPAQSLGIYIGDDGTDESAFAALADGITIRVGRTRGTKAHFYVRNPAGVLNFLARLERELP